MTQGTGIKRRMPVGGVAGISEINWKRGIRAQVKHLSVFKAAASREAAGLMGSTARQLPCLGLRAVQSFSLEWNLKHCTLLSGIK